MQCGDGIEQDSVDRRSEQLNQTRDTTALVDHEETTPGEGGREGGRDGRRERRDGGRRGGGRGGREEGEEEGGGREGGEEGGEEGEEGVGVCGGGRESKGIQCDSNEYQTFTFSLCTYIIIYVYIYIYLYSGPLLDAEFEFACLSD